MPEGEKVVRILFVADVFGAPGRRALERHLRELREDHGVDFCIANGENTADGMGLTARLAEPTLMACGLLKPSGMWEMAKKLVTQWYAAPLVAAIVIFVVSRLMRRKMNAVFSRWWHSRRDELQAGLAKIARP